MSRNEENAERGTGSSAPQENTGLNNDPGKSSQRGTHVNNSRDEQPGGLQSDRKDEKNTGDHAEGDSTQDGTQSRSGVDSSSDSGAGSGNLTEENQATRRDKFGPEGRTSGL